MAKATSKSLLSTFLIAIILCGLALVAGVPQIKAASKTITVPDEYSTIQAAIGNASAGDTVFVKNGTYYPPNQFGEIVIDKPLYLSGENPQSTVINGNYDKRYPLNQGWVTIRIAASNVTISDFTITNCEYAISIDSYGYELLSGIAIVGNNIKNNSVGIEHQDYTSSNFLISENNISNYGNGIVLAASNSVISGNNITGNAGEGLDVGRCKNVTISDNNITGNGFGSVNIGIVSGGLGLSRGGPFYVYKNNITDNQGSGVKFEGSINSSVHDNYIAHNSIGVSLPNYVLVENATVGSGNTVFDNNLVNSQNAFVENAYPYGNVSNFYSAIGNGTDIVSWDNGKVGNYWSDYNGTDKNGDGIGDTPYVIEANSSDHYPLMLPVDIENNATVLPTPSPSTTPSPSPTQQPTLTPAVEPFSTTLVMTVAIVVVIATIVLVVLIIVGLLRYIVKSKKVKS